MPTLHCRILTVGRHCTERASEPTTSFQVCCAECSLCLPHLNSSGKIEAHHPIIAALVAAGANVNAQSRADRATPLVVASYYDSGWAVLLEASCGADPTVAATCVCALRLSCPDADSVQERQARPSGGISAPRCIDCADGCAQIARRMAVTAAPGVHPDTNHHRLVRILAQQSGFLSSRRTPRGSGHCSPPPTGISRAAATSANRNFVRQGGPARGCWARCSDFQETLEGCPES